MSDPPIANFSKVDADLWRGARPDAAGARWLSDQGVKTVINLEWEQGDQDAFHGLPPVLVTLQDFEPLPLLAPCLEDRHIKALLAVLGANPKVIFIHCRSGQNRTGVAVAAYRILVKHDLIGDVISDFWNHGGIWRDADEAYLRGLDARRADLTGEKRGREEAEARQAEAREKT